jgi:hypothetical protein
MSAPLPQRSPDELIAAARSEHEPPASSTRQAGRASCCATLLPEGGASLRVAGFTRGERR